MTDEKSVRPARELTHQVHVGSVAVGGGAPVSVQSMCTTKTDDPASTLAQIEGLAKAGCEIIRVAIPNAAALDGFGEICAQSPLPVVADIHFDHRLAIEAARRGAAALRINPGNIGSFDRVDAVIDEAGSQGIPIRIGVNAGSLDPKVDARQDLTLPQKLVASASSYVEHFRERGFDDIVLSAKAHSVPITLQTYRMLSRELPTVPLHVGVTEAGTLRQGTVKNCVGVGILLEQGIGDTMRLSLTADPVEEVNVAWDLLSSLGMRRLHPELVSCPTCERPRRVARRGPRHRVRPRPGRAVPQWREDQKRPGRPDRGRALPRDRGSLRGRDRARRGREGRVEYTPSVLADADVGRQ